VLEICLDYHTPQNALASHSKTLDETHARLRCGIPTEHKQHALRIGEAVDAIVLDTEGNQYCNLRYRMTTHKMPCHCSSLVVMVVSTKDRSHDEYEKIVELRLGYFSVKEHRISNRLHKDIAQMFQIVGLLVSKGANFNAQARPFDIVLEVQG